MHNAHGDGDDDDDAPNSRVILRMNVAAVDVN